MTKPRIAIIGLGICGSSIAAYLAEAGYNVDGYDQFEPPHSQGSSHSENRLIRQAPAEGEVYVSMVQRAFDLWREVERKSGKKLLLLNGCIDISDKKDCWADQSYALAQKYGLKAEKLSAAEAQNLLPLFQFREGMDITFSPHSGTVMAEKSISALLDIARKNNAKLHMNTKIDDVDVSGKSIIVQGEKRKYDFIIVSAGSWMAKLMHLNVRIEKRVLGWYPFENRYKNMPGFTYIGNKYTMYGMAGINGSALKMGEGDREYAELDPDAPLEVDRNDISMMQDASHACLQNVNFNKIRYAACKYTRTKDKDFIMDRHTENANVLMFSPCSGHGFKYGPLYGEIAEAMIKGQENSLPFDIQSFALSRFD